MTYTTPPFCNAPTQINCNTRTLLHLLDAANHGFFRLARTSRAAKVPTFALKNRLSRPSAKFAKVLLSLRERNSVSRSETTTFRRAVVCSGVTAHGACL